MLIKTWRSTAFDVSVRVTADCLCGFIVCLREFSAHFRGFAICLHDLSVYCRALPESCSGRLWLLLLAVPFVSASAQDFGAGDNTNARERIAVFLDCGPCDDAFIRREITFVDHVREREQADVHVLVTVQGTGGGGREFTFDLIGQGTFDGEDHSVTYASPASNTEDDERIGVVRTLKVALVPYLMQTPLAGSMSVQIDESVEVAPEDDPWNGWTVEFYGDGFGNMEASQYSLSVRYGVFVDRVTETWKIRLRPYFNYSIDEFEQDEEVIHSESHRDGFDSYVIRSINDHWSVGLFGDAFMSTFSNIDLRLRGSPAIEYSVYPYREASRRELTFAYRAGMSHVQYRDTTIFDQISEVLPGHAIDANYELTQTWGSLDVGVEASQYLHDPSKYRLEFDGGVSVRLTRGLSLRFETAVNLIHDQLNLPRGDAPLEEVLLRRRQLATNFELYGSIGFRYRFGSIYNNVVNTRF